MKHAFDIDVAAECGMAAAVILQHLHFWVEQNRAAGRNEAEGRYWTFNSAEKLKQFFPYLTARQVRYALNKLLKAEYIIASNFNKIGIDRTTWYALTDKAYEAIKSGENGENTTILQNCKMHLPNLSNASDKNVKCILQNCQMHLTKLSNASDKIVTPIPDIKHRYKSSDSNADINTGVKSKKKIPASKLPPDHNDDPENKKAFAEFVYLTDKEHESLIRQYGPEMTAELIDILSNYKKQQQRGYYSDVGAIRNWCVDKYKKRHQYDKPRVKDAVTEAIEILERGAIND